MKRIQIIPVTLIMGAILVLMVMFFTGSLQSVFGNVTNNTPNVTPNTFREYTFFATTTNQTVFSTTTNATSTNILQWTDSNGVIDKGYFVVAGANKVTVYFDRTVAGIGSSKFSIQTSPDGTNWYDFNKLVQATTTNSSTISNTPMQGMATTGTAVTSLSYGLNLDYESVYAIRCVIVNLVDGTNQCKATATY